MSWLFWILLIVLTVFAIQGFRKGMVRTAISMVFFIIVIGVTSWLNPYVGDFIREKTSWQEEIQQGCWEILIQKIEKQMEVSIGSEQELIDGLPLPKTMKEKLAENNNTEGYSQMAADSFADYLAGYLAYAIINGIAFVISFVLTILIAKMILYAVDILTELPVVGSLNRLGGIVIGIVQGILWIWIFFLIITLLCGTEIGGYLMNTIREDPVLIWIYDRNYLMMIIMRVFA